MANEFALIPSWRTAFVTGAAGFIASNLVDRLLSEGLTVIGYDNFSTGMPEFVVPAKGSERFNLIEGDLLDAERVVQAMQGAEFVFHLAANADVRRGLEHPHKDLEQNTIATFNVLEGMRKNGIGGIAFPSTGPVYGEPTIFPTPEDAPFPVQTSLYGASKLACEGMISAYCEGYRMRAWIFRFVSILGERYTHGHVYDFVRQLRENPKVLPVLGNGLQRKSYLYIQDCINAIFTAVSRAEGKVNIFNLGAEDYCEVRDSARWIAARMGLSPEFQFGTSDRGWIGDNPFVFLDTTRIRSLGWKQQLSIRQGVEHTVDWLMQNPWIFERRS
ncbi:MAG: NAD-dependent epimerase/dehydratase family protein [Methylovirgula sp.]